MPSNNNIMSIRFGPNKTAKQFYIQLFLACACLVILAILCTILLISYDPQLQKSIHKFFYPSSAAAPLSQSRDKSATPTQNETHSPGPSKLSERNDLDPLNPADLLPDDLFPSSSAKVFDVMEEAASSPSVTRAEDEQENPNDVQGTVMKVTWVKPKPIDVFTGSDIVIKTRMGKVKGIQGDVLGQKVNAFLGIPYTEEAAIGDRRFTRSTKRTTPWQGILNAHSYKPHCPQVFDEDVIDKRTVVVHDISEDCLYLNLWSPVPRSSTGQSLSSGGSGSRDGVSKKKSSSPPPPLKPVMVWIFGGGYSGGSNNMDEMDGRMLAALGDVVVVTLNYRIGSFGFLDMGVNEAPGNMGLYDCLAGLFTLLPITGTINIYLCMKSITAIQFVKDNIESFGGDPNEMTLFGQSAGAISIGLLMTNNNTSKYFKRVIMESGSPIMLNFFFTRSELSAEKFVKSMNCSQSGETSLPESDEITDMESEASTTSDPVTTENGMSATSAEDREYEERKRREVQCLKSKTMQELLVGQRSLLQVAFPFTPTPLEQLLPIMPYDALSADPGSKAYQDTFNNFQEVLIGSNTDEASVILHLEIPQIFEADKIKLNITTLEGLKDFLINNLSAEFSIDYQTAILFTNVFFNRGPEEDTTINLVKRLYQVVGDLAFVCPVFAFAEGLAGRGKTVYQYEFGYRSSASPWGEWMGVTHGDEYIFTFGHPLRYPDRYSQDDITMSRRMIDIWSTFAKTG